ncbi:M1 family aminopeptidase [Hyphomonas sp.]|uniref:M1 family metallopeptidase n=1 Tax=Hyphomonas sp. TaxID=87 RepID=UPI00391B8ECB
MRWIGLVAALCLVATACAQRSAWTLPVQSAGLEELQRAAPAGRLPGIARPATYRAALDLDPREDNFSGTVEIDIDLKAAVTGLWLHGENLDVSRITATAGGETVEASWTEVLDTGVVWVGFPKRLEARRVTLSIDYTAPFDVNLAGLFRVESQGRRYALAKSESIQARRFLPGFDEPGFKAVFDMAITVPDGMHAIANTPEVSREPARDGHVTIRFAPTRPLSTYLLSTAVGEFDRIERPPLPPNKARDFEVPLTGYTRAGKASELDFALNLTADMVRVFEEMLRQPYPYEKLDIIASPQWPSGATELAAAITYNEARILKGPDAGPALIRALKEIHAHEIAHMWFGNLVTPPWWDDLWLKEAFASWAEVVILEALEPYGNHDVAAVADGLTAMALDSQASVRAVAEPISRNEDIRNAYDAITYSKGQSIIRMVDHYFTPDRFRPALGRYISQFADGEADSADFYASIARVTGEPAIGEVFRSFVTQRGIPLIEADVSCGKGAPKLTLSQSRYRPLGSTIDPGTRWTIPVCTSWQDGANSGETCTLLSTERKVIDLKGAMCPGVIVPNADGAGYYRFNLTADRWAALGSAISEMPSTEALVSVDSASAAFAAGSMSGEAYLGVLIPALAHNEAAVLSSSLRAIETLLTQLADHPASEEISARAAAALDARSARLSGPEAEARILGFRAEALRDPAARADLLRRLQPLLDGSGGLSTDLYAPALRVTFADGGAATFDRILAASARIDDAVFTSAVATAIGAVADPALAARAETLMREGAFGPAASQSIATSLMANPLHRETVWQNLKADFPGFLSVIPSQTRRATPRLARGFCDPARASEIEAFFAAQGRAVAGHERALAETVEYLTLCSVQAEAARAAFSP